MLSGARSALGEVAGVAQARRQDVVGREFHVVVGGRRHLALCNASAALEVQEQCRGRAKAKQGPCRSAFEGVRKG
jgi:hypothetical protein